MCKRCFIDRKRGLYTVLQSVTYYITTMMMMVVVRRQWWWLDDDDDDDDEVSRPLSGTRRLGCIMYRLGKWQKPATPSCLWAMVSRSCTGPPSPVLRLRNQVLLLVISVDRPPRYFKRQSSTKCHDRSCHVTRALLKHFLILSFDVDTEQTCLFRPCAL